MEGSLPHRPGSGQDLKALLREREAEGAPALRNPGGSHGGGVTGQAEVLGRDGQARADAAQGERGRREKLCLRWQLCG